MGHRPSPYHYSHSTLCSKTTMLAPYIVQIDRDRLAQRLAGVGREPLLPAELDAWLRSHGFSKLGDTWRVEWHRCLADVTPDEVTDVRLIGGRSVFKPGASFLPSANALKQEFERIEARNAEMARAAPPESIELCKMPAILIGRSKQAVSRWRTVTRRAAKVGSWEQALRDVPMVAIDHAPGDLLFHHFAGPHDWPNVVLHAVHDHFATDTRRDDRAEWSVLKRQLLLDGINHFWFTLASLAGHWGLIVCDASDQERQVMTRAILRSFVHWWPEFIRLSPRFLGSGDHPLRWPQWGREVLAICSHLNVSQEQIAP
jgi:hypothetical protein